MANPVGRPRTVSLQPDEMIALGEEMIAWIIENQPMHLTQWYSIHKMYTDKQWDTMQVCPEFFPYYERALKIIGLQYLRKDSPIENSLKQRWQRVYFKDLKFEEDDTAKFQSELRTKENKATSDDDLKRYSDFMAYLKTMKQDHASALKSDENKNSTESKS